MSRNEEGQRADDDPTDELYVLPPGEFVAARNRVASELKKGGKKEAAAAVKAMAKPSASVWAVNQVARNEPAAMKRFLAVSDELRRAQTRGGGNEEARRAFHAAQAGQREALEQVLGLAERALSGAGVGASRAVLDWVANVLRWGALSDDARALLGRGRLLHDVGPPDFAALLGELPLADVAKGKPKEREQKAEPRKPDKGGKADAEGEGRREAEAATRERARFLRAALAAARAQEARAQTTATRARGARERAERAVETARKELTRLESEATDAARAHAEADETVSTQSAEVARLTRELEETEA